MAERQRPTNGERYDQFGKCLIASAIALAVDYGSYRALTATRWIDLPTAAVAGYSIGLVVSYFLMAGRVFTDCWLRDKKKFEVPLFLVSGLLGNLLTYLTVAIYVHLLGEQETPAKLAAIAVSFFSVFAFRKLIVFRIREGDT